MSVTRVDHTKAVEERIMKFSPYGSPIPLVFAGEVSSRNSLYVWQTLVWCYGVIVTVEKQRRCV